jgi:hypothetical protein
MTARTSEPSTEVAAQGTKPASAGWTGSNACEAHSCTAPVREGGLGSSSRDFSRRLARPLVVTGIALLALAVASPLYAADLSDVALAKSEPAPWWQKLQWTWVAGGLAAGSATAAVFAGVHANELEDRYHAALATSRDTPQPASTVLALGDRARGQATLSSVLWGVAGVCAITGGALAWLELSAPEDHGEVFVAPVALPGGAGLSLGGRF